MVEFPLRRPILIKVVYVKLIRVDLHWDKQFFIHMVQLESRINLIVGCGSASCVLYADWGPEKRTCRALISIDSIAILMLPPIQHVKHFKILSIVWETPHNIIEFEVGVPVDGKADNMLVLIKQSPEADTPLIHAVTLSWRNVRHDHATLPLLIHGV